MQLSIRNVIIVCGIAVMIALQIVFVLIGADANRGPNNLERTATAIVRTNQPAMARIEATETAAAIARSNTSTNTNSLVQTATSIVLRATAMEVESIFATSQSAGLALSVTSTPLPSQTSAALSGTGGALPDAGGGGGSRADVLTVLTRRTQPQQRIILKNGRMSIVADDPETTVSDITKMAEEMGGWLVNSYTNSFVSATEDILIDGSVEVRVPADQLEFAMAQVREDAIEVRDEFISGQDVTDEFVDISSRLVTLQAAEEQLVALIESSESVEDVLAVRRELTNVRAEIEQIQGRLNFIGEAAAFSLLTVNVRPVQPAPTATPTPTTTPTLTPTPGWNPGTTVAESANGVVLSLQFIVDWIIRIVIFGVVFGLILGIPGWMFVRWVLRRLNRPSANE